jgi:hypothetical protein
MQQWIKDAHFEQLEKIVVGILVLIIENIDMSKRVVYGAMEIVKFAKFNDVKTYQI